MKFRTVSASLFCVLLRPQQASALYNANHIFNAVHSAMRQWGSSLNHNGMSLYLVTVPAETQLYHGRGNSELEEGMEWLAFEPEHALLFARPWSVPPLEDYYEDSQASTDSAVYMASANSQQRSPSASSRLQLPLGDGGHRSRPPPSDSDKGYLHTYRTNRDQQFLYLDGQSAAKTDMGTLDTQDVLLLNKSGRQCSHDRDLPCRPDPLADRERALELCQLIKQEWGSQLAGVVRMEHGFELMVCSFKQSVDRIRVAEVVVPASERRDGIQGMTVIRNIAARYHGIGGGRIHVYWDSLVSAYTYPLPVPDEDHLISEFAIGENQALLSQWPTNNTEHRLMQWPATQLAELRSDVLKGIKHAINASHTSTVDGQTAVDWQAVADMIVLRYAAWLQTLLLPENTQDPVALRTQLQLMQRPFVDGQAPNASQEALLCTQQFLPLSLSGLPSETQAEPLATRAVSHIAHLICETVAFAAHDLEQASRSEPEELERPVETVREAVVKRIRDLVDYLQWTTWKECRGCAYNEVCIVAIWPWGTVQDHEQPSCANASQLMNRGGYW